MGKHAKKKDRNYILQGQIILGFLTEKSACLKSTAKSKFTGVSKNGYKKGCRMGRM